MIQRISILFFLWSFVVFSQENNNQERIPQIENRLNNLVSQTPGLVKKVDFNVSNIELPSFIRAVGKESKVNISVDPQLSSVVLSHSFSNAKVKDILVYLCKEYHLDIAITGNIISLKQYTQKPPAPKQYVPRNIEVSYDSGNNLLSFDLQNDSLSVAFKKITDVTGKNLVFSPGLGNKTISGYIKNKPFESAMDKLAFSNNLLVTKTKDNYYLFESNFASNGMSSDNGQGVSQGNRPQRPARYRNSNFFFKVIDLERQLVDVDFENTSIASVIQDIGFELNTNVFTNTPLNDIGTASVKASNITYDVLLTTILEDTQYTYKKQNGMYYFGKREQASLRNTEIIPLMHRSIEVMNQPMQSSRGGFNSNYNSGNIYNSSTNSNTNYDTNSSFNNQNQQGYSQNNSSYTSPQRLNTQSNRSFGSSYQSKSEALVNILPSEVVEGLEVKTDVEHNTFIVTGDAQKIEKFKSFIRKIDKPVPVILIEVMILEVSRNAAISAGTEFHIGDKPVATRGQVYPKTELTLGASAINKLIGGINNFGSVNIGKVVPNFYAKIQAMESNGSVKVRSTPKLSTLNGHQAMLSNGERSYYTVTRKDIIGSQNPLTSEVKNYVPIDADLSIAIRPLVSGDEQITLSINVVQSSFNGKRIDEDAPPGMNSREFTSTIRVRDQDVIVLGGLEENAKSNSGSGVPFLAKIPIIKWLFSKRTRTASKSKLSVLIKPTIIR